MAAAITDAYATVAEYRSAISKTDAGKDADITVDLLAVSRWLDRALGRFFTRDAADVARVFYPRVNPTAAGRPLDWAESENPWRWGGWARWLHIDDLSAAPTSVIIDANGDGSFVGDTPFGANDFELWPQNAALGPEPAPYTAIFIPSYTTQIGGFPQGRKVQVVGRWGWPAVPPAIQRGTIQLTGILRLESPRATTRVNEMGDVVGTSKEARSIVDQLLENYRKASSFI